MNELIHVLQNGVSEIDFGLTLNRIALGVFFAISGYHKLFNAERHQAIIDTFKSIGVPFIGFNQWFVPAVEFLGGLSLISGVLAPFAASGLLVICLVASCTDGVKRIQTYKPIDLADVIDDVLYLPEVLYCVGLVLIITSGPGGLTLI